MVKRLLSILLIGILLLFSSCTVRDNQSNGQTNQGAIMTEDRDDLWATLEETLDNATHIVEAEAVDGTDENGDHLIRFRVKSQLKGECPDEYIYVSTENMLPAQKAEYAQVYLPSFSYLLILRRYVDVYYEHDRYIVLSGAYLPTHRSEQWSLRGRKALRDCSACNDSDLASPEALMTYIANCVKEDTTPDKAFYGLDFIRTDDLQTIVEQSPAVLKVRIVEPKNVSNAISYVCEVVKVYKGEMENATFTLRTFDDTLKVDEEYIVAVTQVASNTFYYTSKHSLMQTDVEDAIEQCLGFS